MTKMRQNYSQILYRVSQADDGNMSLKKGSKKEVLENRQKFLTKLGLNLDSIVSLSLEHGTKIIEVCKSNLGKMVGEADGLITNKKGVNLFILVADCIALALYDPQKQAIGLIHAGRIGLEKGTFTQAVLKMAEIFGSKPQDLIAQFSPSIGPCCYKPAIPKISSEVLKSHMIQDKKGIYSIDIWSWAENQLKEAGVLPANIANPKICTYHSGKYFSHKKYKMENLKQDPRFAVVLGIKP